MTADASGRVVVDAEFHAEVYRPVSGGFTLSDGGIVRWEGDDDVAWDPLAEKPLLFLEAADVRGGPENPDPVLEFANRYGPITRPAGYQDGSAYFRISDWLSVMTAICFEVELLAGDGRRREERMPLDLPEATFDLRRRCVVVQASTLEEVCAAQMIGLFRRGDSFHHCVVCDDWIVHPHSKVGPPPDYCSQSCRFKAYRIRQKHARELSASGKTPAKIAKELGSTTETVRGWLKK